MTELPWPSRVASQFPVSASQSLRVSSELPETMRRPSGENAQAPTGPAWPARVQISDSDSSGRVRTWNHGCRPTPARRAASSAARRAAASGKVHCRRL